MAESIRFAVDRRVAFFRMILTLFVCFPPHVPPRRTRLENLWDEHLLKPTRREGRPKDGERYVLRPNPAPRRGIGGLAAG